MDLEFMDQLQRTVVKKALVNPELAAILTKDEVQELFLKVSDINAQFWCELAQRLQKGGVGK